MTMNSLTKKGMNSTNISDLSQIRDKICYDADKFLTARIENASRNRIQQAAEAKCILVNGNPVKSNYKVKPYDIVSVVMDRPRYELEIIPENIPLNIVYEDDDVLVVNKPAGLCCTSRTWQLYWNFGQCPGILFP